MPDSPSKPKRKRRWFQFRLRTLLLLVTVFAVLFGWVAHKAHNAREQKRVVAWLREKEAFMRYDYQIDDQGEDIINAALPGPKWIRDVLGIDFVDSVVLAYVMCDRLDDYSVLAGLPDLEEVSFDCTNVGAPDPLSRAELGDLSPLSGLKKLRSLKFYWTSGNDLTSLAEVSNLQELTLFYTDDHDLTFLADLENLESLDLEHIPVTDIAPLHRLTNLRNLNLVCTGVTEVQVEALRQALPNCVVQFDSDRCGHR
jgi:hypothetical protein